MNNHAGKIGMIVVGIVGFLVLVLGIVGFLSSGKESSKKEVFSLEEVKTNFLLDNTVMLANTVSKDSITATVQKNKLHIKIVKEGNDSSYTLQLKNNILTLETSDTVIVPYLVSLTDAVGVLEGYQKGDTYSLFEETTFSDYTVEKEGIEYKQVNEKISFKIDLSKTRRIKLLSTSSLYFKPENFIDFKDFIVGDGTYSSNIGNVMLSKTGTGEEATIIIGEKNAITNNSYQSILAILTVMFSEEEAIYFSSQYPIFLEEETSFGGYTVTNHYVYNGPLANSYTGYQFTKITINKQEVNQR